MKKALILTVVILIAVLALAACGGGEEKAEPAAAESAAGQPVATAGDAEAGKKLFATACVACHGPNGEGVQGLGKDLKVSTFVAENDDAQMLEFLKKGRDVTDPLNTTKVAMPPKGGNPALNDQDLANLVAYIRSLHQQ
ncbi:MAG: cytochrome c [Anaerolineales bacterium]|nr:cytochrome c [Anaerolineales bacterium]